MAGPRPNSRCPGAALALLAGLLLGSAPAQAQSPAELQGYQQRLQQLFRRLDQNGDQRLDRREVEGHPYLERHFTRLDQQQRGYLSPTDLRGPEGGGTANGGERARRFFSQADRNRDGQLSRQEAEPYPWLQRRFQEVDRNGDGVVSREELRQVRPTVNPAGR